MSNRTKIAAAILSVLGGLCVLAKADDPRTQQVEDQLKALQFKVNQLEAKQAAPNVFVSPATQPSGKYVDPYENQVISVLVDSKPIQFPNNVSAGYDHGFYLKQGDDFQIQFNGLIDARYTFTAAKNKTGLGTTALGTATTGDLSGFNLFNGEFSASGHVFKNVFFMAMGNFGSLSTPTSPQSGAFEISELYLGYEFSPSLRVRAGSMIVPYLPLRSITNYGGLMFPDIANSAVAFLPGYTLGVDVLGTLRDNTISYDLLLGDGSNSQNLIDSNVPANGRDNRLAVYTREQFVGSGKLSDFVEESDLQDHQNFCWMLGAGFGYESQNAAANAFPAPQTSLQINGLSSATGEGFAPKYNANGSIERYVGDFRTKYKGWSIFGEAYYQHITSEGGTPIVPGYTQHSIGEVGYFIESGYFVIPRKLEVAGRFGQLYTNGLRHEMDEYEIGLNYYPLGQNLKLQFAETYVPRAAALTNNNGIIQNTQDWETQLQVQLKF